MRILVVLGTRGLGDALEAFPAFELLRELAPEARLAVGCQSPAQERTVEMCPAVAERVRIRDGSVKSAWRALLGFGQNLAAMRGFDVVVFLYKRHVAWPAALAARFTGARVFHKHSYHYRDRRRSVYSDFPARVFNQLIVAEFFGHVLSRLREPRIILAEPERRFADEFFASHDLGRRPTVMLNSMASTQIRGWGIERYGRVASALVERGVDVIVNSGTDRQVREFRSLAPALGERVRFLDTRDPAQLAAVIARCALLIGEPTGQSWLATAVGTPVVALIGPGEQNYHGQGRAGPVWWPWGSACTFLSKVAWCQTAMGERCLCRRERGRRQIRRAMKRLGVWQWAARLLKAAGLRRGRGRRERPMPPCLEALEVDEVVETAVGRLGLGGDRIPPQPAGAVYALR